MFMEIAIAAIGIGIVLMVGYLVIAQVKGALPGVPNPCLGVNASAPGNCYGLDNTSAFDPKVTTGLNGAQATVFAGFGLLAVGIIVLAAFGLIQVFK